MKTSKANVVVTDAINAAAGTPFRFGAFKVWHIRKMPIAATVGRIARLRHELSMKIAPAKMPTIAAFFADSAPITASRISSNESDGKMTSDFG